MFQLSLFRIRAFTVGNLAGLAVSIARGGLQFMLIIWLQGIWLPLHGYTYSDTPLWAGIFLLPLTAGFLASGPVAGHLSDRFGSRGIATAGMVVFCGSFVGLLLPVNFPYWAFAVLIAANGIGSGMFAAPNSSSIMGSVPARQRGAATRSSSWPTPAPTGTPRCTTSSPARSSPPRPASSPSPTSMPCCPRTAEASSPDQQSHPRGRQAQLAAPANVPVQDGFPANHFRQARGLTGCPWAGRLPVGMGMMNTFAQRLRRVLLLVIALLAAASIAAGCGQASSIAGKLSPSGGARTSPDSSASVAPSSPTAAPTTVQPSVTATTPATTPPAVTVTPTAAPTPTVSGSPAPAAGAASLLWLWVLLAVIVIVGLIALIGQAARRRAARNRTWRAMAVNAFAKGSALHDAVYAASLPGQYGAGDAAARWADIERRADDLSQTLYALREAAPTEDERARVDDVLASLQALRSATQTGDMPSAGGPYSSNLQTRLQYFQAALQALRGPE